MTSRALLYAHAVRNAVGRTFGLAAAYTPAQRATCMTMASVFALALYDLETQAALVADVDGETSFLLMARGDKGQAGGAAQWHNARRQVIKTHTSIDVWIADAADQARAMIAEMTQPWSSYRHVDQALRAAQGVEAKVRVMVALYEQSGSQARDVARRTAMANYWLTQLKSLPHVPPSEDT